MVKSGILFIVTMMICATLLYFSGIWVLIAKLYYNSGITKKLDTSWPYSKTQLSGVYAGTINNSMFIWTYFGLQRISLSTVQRWTLYSHCQQYAKLLKMQTAYFEAIQTSLPTNDLDRWIKNYPHGSSVIIKFGEGGILTGSIYDYVITNKNGEGFVCIK